MNRILVTGCAGFIGSHIIEALKEANHKVFNIDKTKSNFGDVYEDIDINDSSKVEEFLKRPGLLEPKLNPYLLMLYLSLIKMSSP